MPLVGWICPEHGEQPNRNNKFDYCITKCSAPCVAPHVLEALRLAEIGNYHTGKRISVTMLAGGCKRRTVLERTLDYYQFPEVVLPTFRGSMIHAIIEQSTSSMKERGWKIELSMELPVTTTSGNWLLTGTLDAFDPSTETIYDIKTLQEYAVTKLVQGKNDGIFSSHIPDNYVKQLNIYRYIAKKAGLFDAKRLRLQIVTFGGLILTGTSPVVTTKSGFKWNTEKFTIPDIPIIDDKNVENWIQSEGDEWYNILYNGGHAPVVPTENAWLCKKCIFKETHYCPDPDKERSGDPVAMLVPTTEHI